MKKILIFLLFPFALNAQQISATADSLLIAYNKQDLFTGNVLIAKKGVVVFAKSYGLADREKMTPNTMETTFRIGSVSKSFTAVVILQLQEKRLLTLNDPLSKYLPGFPKGDSIKISNLLSNTSGIKDFTAIKGLYPWTKFNYYTEIIPVIAQQPLQFSPGEKFSYSSSNFLLLCAIAEKVTGKKYEQLLDELIIKKLNLKHTGIDNIKRKDAKKAIGYTASIADFYVKSDSINIGILAGAGGMYSTVNDLLAFDRAVYENRLLTEKSKQLLFAPNKGDYGFGYEITKLKDKQINGHSGAIDGFKANLFTFPDSETTVVVLANYADIQSFELYEALKRVAVAEPFEMPKPHVFIHIKESDLKKYIGEYAINENISLSLRVEQGKLVANIAGEDGLVLYPETNDDFYIRAKNANIKLVRDDKGEVNAVQVIKGSRASTWKRKTAK